MTHQNIGACWHRHKNSRFSNKLRLLFAPSILYQNLSSLLKEERGECRLLLDRGSRTKSVLIKSRSSENEGPFRCTNSNDLVPVPLVFLKKQRECQAFVCNLWSHFTYGLKILCLCAALEAWRLQLWWRGKSNFVQAKMKAIVFGNRRFF